MIEDLVRRIEAGEDDLIDQVADIAAADPGRVAPYLLRLLDADARWRAEVLYRGGDEEFQQELIRRIDSGETDFPARLVFLLTQMRGPVVTAAFIRWRDSPPPGIDPYERGVDALARDGGWELEEHGVRELCGSSAFQLVPEPGATPAVETCPWCGSSLWAALDVDTADAAVEQALTHTGWKGRLRISVCHLCTCYDTIYVTVTSDGGSAWSPHTVRPSYLQVGQPEPPPENRMVLGARRATDAMAGAWDSGGSTLGGRGDWIQDPTYPTCPGCRRAMDYVGLVNGADLWDGEGAYYLYVHAPCGLAAVHYQQS
ncbi:hypothetical protein [Streptosporangium vulgare]|uniref:DUF1963 domain-containing protein n=1 Tax=Streptosporangium vulgare TaxID=46190 RepID=A0ABV5TA08_9ACTN